MELFNTSEIKSIKVSVEMYNSIFDGLCKTGYIEVILNFRTWVEGWFESGVQWFSYFDRWLIVSKLKE